VQGVVHEHITRQTKQVVTAGALARHTFIVTAPTTTMTGFTSTVARTVSVPNVNSTSEALMVGARHVLGWVGLESSSGAQLLLSDLQKLSHGKQVVVGPSQMRRFN
jgi:hypothetical protein